MTGQQIEDMDEAIDTAKGYRSLMHGLEPVLVETASRADEFAQLVVWLRTVDLESRTVGICAHTRRQRDEIGDHLTAHGFNHETLEREGDDSVEPGIKLLTMHRSKGLEFNAVCLMFVGGRISRTGSFSKDLLAVTAR